MIAPHTAHLAWDTKIAPGAVIEPYVVFGAGRLGGDRRGDPRLLPPGGRAGGRGRADRSLCAAAARRRHRRRPPTSATSSRSRRSKVGAGAKANHLAIWATARSAPGANIGAGTIFCNYDGFDKHDTHVGEGAFVGSNSSLVAPVTIGAGAYTGSGSVISRDVAPDALALERGVQTEKPGWAAAFRLRKMPEPEAEMTADEMKRAAGEAAADLVQPGHDRRPRHRLDRRLVCSRAGGAGAGP